MDFIQFLQAVSSDSTHLIMIVFMVMSYSRTKARQKALEGQLQALKHDYKVLYRQMREAGLILPFPDDLDL